MTLPFLQTPMSCRFRRISGCGHGHSERGKNVSGPSHLKVSVEITLPLIPSHQGRGNLLAPSPLVGEGWGEGAYKIKCEGPLLDHDISF